MTPAAADFKRANDRHPVIEAIVLGHGGQGARYWLGNHKSFKLTSEDIRSLPEGYPRWRGGNAHGVAETDLPY